MIEDFDRCVRAVRSRDARFDGWFFTAVVTTRIYCRPSCPVAPPRVENMTFYPSAAAAQLAGFRACKRCRPDATPGSPEWNVRGDTVARAMRLIADGVVDREGVGGLATRLGYSTRQLQRLLFAEVGTGALALARAQRAQTARLLIETTTIPMTDVAYGAGFASLRQFNATVSDVFALTPTAMRASPTRPPAVRTSAEEGPGLQVGVGTVALRLAFRRPLCPESLFGHLVATAVPHCEEYRDGWYRRTLRLPHGAGVVALAPHADHITCRLALADLRDLAVATNRCRRLLDLDADPVAIDEALGDDRALAPIIGRGRGRRVPGTVDANEMALRAVLGQQVSTAAARTHAARLVHQIGTPIGRLGLGYPDGLAPAQGGGLTHLFPEASALVDLDPATLALPERRRSAAIGLARMLANGGIDLGAGGDWARARAQLNAMAGLGPWTVETIAMRALGDPDAFLPTDLGVRTAAAAVGLPRGAASLTTHAERWRPWRAYAVQYLWSTCEHAINRLPGAAVLSRSTGPDRRRPRIAKHPERTA